MVQSLAVLLILLVNIYPSAGLPLRDTSLLPNTAPVVPTPARTAEEWYEEGYNKAENEDYAGAIAAYTEAIELNPEYAWAYNNRGNAYKNSELYDLALADYNEAIRLEPEYAYVFNNRGIVYAKLGKYELAIADYTRSIALNNPELYIPYYNRARDYEDMGELELALADYTVAADMGYNMAYFSRLFLYEDLGEPENALKDAAYYALHQTTLHPVESLTANQAVQIVMSEGYTFRWTIRLTKGQAWQFSGTSPDDVDSFMILLAPDGTALAYHDDIDESNYDSQLRYEVTESGVYTLLITHAGGETEGRVAVQAEPVTASDAAPRR